MDTRLHDNILRKQHHTKFHMPGHKGRSFSQLHWEAWDTTELEGTDNLNDPKREIHALEKDLACIYGTKETMAVVNGATSAMMAAILGSFQPGDKVLIPRNAHKSVFGGLYYGRLSPVYIQPVLGLQDGYPVGIRIQDVRRAMEAHPDAKGMIMTYPSYYGTCDDIQGISGLCRQRGWILIVDEAHGAHFHFGKNYPASALSTGADVVIHSTHKTLPSLNPGALLHLCSHRLDPLKIRRHLSMLQTSSPSYPVLLSIVGGIGWMEEHGASRLEELAHWYQWVREEVEKGPFPMVRDAWTIPTEAWDPTKLWFLSNKVEHLGRRLSQEQAVDVEWEDGITALAMAGVGSTEEDYRQLIQGLKQIAVTAGLKEHDVVEPGLAYPAPGMKVLELYDQPPTVQIPLKQAVGRIAAAFLIPYPPGIPVVCPGERISQEIHDYLIEQKEGTTQGLSTDGQVWVCQEGQ